MAANGNPEGPPHSDDISKPCVNLNAFQKKMQEEHKQAVAASDTKFAALERERRKRIAVSCNALRDMLPKFSRRRNDMVAILEMTTVYLELVQKLLPVDLHDTFLTPPEDLRTKWHQTYVTEKYNGRTMKIHSLGRPDTSTLPPESRDQGRVLKHTYNYQLNRPADNSLVPPGLSNTSSSETVFVAEAKPYQYSDLPNLENLEATAAETFFSPDFYDSLPVSPSKPDSFAYNLDMSWGWSCSPQQTHEDSDRVIELLATPRLPTRCLSDCTVEQPAIMMPCAPISKAKWISTCGYEKYV
ncbi:uncharacterized protein LOC120535792 isoform X1 [Polypterus senegalus]|uniref:uncharacterized protein LOC120535792 isoform X1 n=1 Tax=Polypterus senegalus TaxID=55291 RepID=UPI001965CABB|nr:uncharacterized protein LOC120535792 isoform X1 [Polypterus senegalus]